ncbi:uncharacterized protein LOC128673488 [Plodia interpunctella]|uniref:uncharacterized protein LOC128673488 n=1 Tax=Plodia interpunctella TaxID=58824 RepID=UPI00236842BE|nr:uncharacterized protein LOC128673488 [Plodia interpunctella]XP_053607333.1 uncharacterized protein LOC128673488 [Plodia interpunctella]XP_053607335.1 uncharacterized protein LOC128673488 [Plodia interpunctella]XP_053607336.1 uncharacterized protein LOC128673488 [Plodia interpunctella]
MARNLMHCVYYFIVLTVCIDQGDGRWKKKDEEKLRHDIEVFRKMADEIEQEIEYFYDEYPEEGLKIDSKNRINNKYVQNTLNRDFLTKNVNKQDKIIFQGKYTSSGENNNISLKTLNGDIAVNKTSLNKFVSFIDNNNNRLGPKWPKFEELLLEMGKKYDWKNDRWIKVKEKLIVQPDVVNVIRNDLDFHERHKFSYRIVKLNRNKRRNVVVAVSAVR